MKKQILLFAGIVGVGLIVGISALCLNMRHKSHEGVDHIAIYLSFEGDPHIIKDGEDCDKIVDWLASIMKKYSPVPHEVEDGYNYDVRVFYQTGEEKDYTICYDGLYGNDDNFYSYGEGFVAKFEEVSGYKFP